ncbi:MAG: 2-oxoacid:acceptor oxidoreductase family protein [Candidatus Marinimicrobia bacterium]|nr:2-oxoacid:acceptor oxidoreductase family protein [Candidatus Neomarinimicrobiota bacterium]
MKGNGFPFPGISTTTDGAGAVVWVDSHITQGGCAYPITSSTTMGQGYQAAIANGNKNLWGESQFFLEPESEHSSASACEGVALSGGRVTNFTSGQGLVLMKEVLFTISGKRLPCVFHIGARALTSQALNVHAGHDDVIAVADTGWGIVFGRNAQEAGDLALIVRRTAEASETPFMNVQDGFLTTHTIENVLLNEPEMMKEYIGNPKEKLNNYMNPYEPMMSGVVQNQDSYMKGKISQRHFYDKVPGILKDSMDEFYRLTGRKYGFVDGYGLEDAEEVIVAMGSVSETAKVTIDWMKENEGKKAGILNITSYRPFPGAEIVEALKNAKRVAVLERLDIPLGQSNPLTTEIKAAFADAMQGAEGYSKIDTIPRIVSGTYGLGSRDTRPGDLIALFEAMKNGSVKDYFTLGIKHPLALERKIDPDVRAPGSFSMRGHSVGGYGSVTTNKVIATIVADLFDMNVQAYPKYGSEKKGLPTTYYLTISDEPILTHAELNHVEFVPMNDTNAFNIGDPLFGLAEDGLAFVQTSKNSPESLWKTIPDWAKKIIRNRNIRLFGLDTVTIAREVASRPELEQRMQGIVLLGIFLRVTPFVERKKLTEEKLMEGVKRSLTKYFGSKGKQVVEDNLKAVRRGYSDEFEVPRELMAETEEIEADKTLAEA